MAEEKNKQRDTTREDSVSINRQYASLMYQYYKRTKAERDTNRNSICKYHQRAFQDGIAYLSNVLGEA